MEKCLKNLTFGLVVFVFLVGKPSFAFDKTKLGFHIGGSKANLERGELQYDYISSVYAGIRANRAVSRFFSYQFELNYVRKGAETEIFSLLQKTELTTATGTLAVDYLELPLMVKAGPSMNLPFRPSVLAGLYVAWHVGDKISYEDEEVEPVEEFEIAGSDFGFAIGAALDFKVKNRTVALEFRYLRGIKKSIERSSGDRLLNGVLTFVIAITP